ADVLAALEDVEAVLGPCAAEIGAELALRRCEPCSVAASPGVLASLLSNLVRNAIKYLGDPAERRIAVRAIAARAVVRFEVQDTGPGLPPSLEQTVFEPYVRAPGNQKPGIGLGLATVKRLAEAHGGAVGVRSR